MDNRGGAGGGRPGDWKRVLFATGLAFIVLRWMLTWFLPAPGPEEFSLLPAVYPEAYGYSGKKGAPPRYEAFTLVDGGGTSLLGVVFRSTEVAEVPRGYAGPLPLLVGLDREGTITGVRLLEHNETPSYVGAIEQGDFLRQFVGRSLGDPLRLDEDIDGVTRATVTAAAVTEGVRLASRAAGRRILGFDIPAAEPSPPSLPWAALGLFLLLVALTILSLVRPRTPLRWACFLLGLGLLGFWQGVYLSTSTAVNILLWRWPSPGEHLLWYLLVLFGIGAALTWRNAYCARMCPFGALQEILGLFAIRRLPPGPGEESQARNLRAVFLWLVVLAVFLFGRTAAANYEPFSTAFDFKGGALRWVFLAVVLLMAALRHRFWCRYFCPTGLWLQLLGRMRSVNPFE